MKSKKNLVFLGMMGSGKTSIGSIISKKLKKDFIDVDHEIEKELGMKISTIFETLSENYFREIEEKITLRVLKKNNIIISLGGGAFINFNIRKEVLENHISFWLNWSPKTLINRINSSLKRPIAFKASKNELFEIIKKRSKIYSKALYKIECENRTKNQISKKILEIYETN